MVALSRHGRRAEGVELGCQPSMATPPSKPLFELDVVACDELDRYPDGINRVWRRITDGLIVKGVFDERTIAAVLERHARGAPELRRHTFEDGGDASELPYVVTRGLITSPPDLGDYFADAAHFRAGCRELFAGHQDFEARFTGNPEPYQRGCPQRGPCRAGGPDVLSGDNPGTARRPANRPPLRERLPPPARVRSPANPRRQRDATELLHPTRAASRGGRARALPRLLGRHRRAAPHRRRARGPHGRSRPPHVGPGRRGRPPGLRRGPESIMRSRRSAPGGAA